MVSGLFSTFRPPSVTGVTYQLFSMIWSWTNLTILTTFLEWPVAKKVSRATICKKSVCSCNLQKLPKMQSLSVMIIHNISKRLSRATSCQMSISSICKKDDWNNNLQKYCQHRHFAKIVVRNDNLQNLFHPDRPRHYRHPCWCRHTRRPMFLFRNRIAYLV